jgi:uncharacterized protein (TIGR03118 family)
MGGLFMLSVIKSHRNWLFGAALASAAPVSAEAGPYLQTNLVSDISGLATITDPRLINPWGFSHSATSPFWISNQGNNSSTLYAVTGQTNVAKVNIPPNGFVAIPTTASGPQGPTAQVNNGNTSSFAVGNGGNGNSARFIFANLNGTISAWNGGATAFAQATVTGGPVTALTINQAQTQLYTANAGGIQVFNSAFSPLGLVPGAFATPPAIAALGLVTFNVKDIKGEVYVTYAPAGLAAQRAATGGQGAVAVFDESGNLLRTLTDTNLAAPWGLALAPSTFGIFSNALLVGNFSFAESEINAFDSITGAFLGTLAIDTGIATAGGLWEIGFGNGGNNGDPNTLYFTDGINGERNGLFGAITFVPEPFTLSLFGAGLAGMMVVRRRRKAGKA